MVAEQEKRKTIQLESQIKMQEIQAKAQADARVELIKGRFRLQEASIQANAKVLEQKTLNESNAYIKEIQLQAEREAKELAEGLQNQGEIAVEVG